MAKRKARADCRADTRGGPWAGIPVCVIKSPAYRDLSLWARAILVELAARMNGYNNGAIGLSHREISEALGNSNLRRIGAAVVELIEHGFLYITVDGAWKQRQARQYRLTFVTTAHAPFGATNEYRNWTNSKKLSHDEASAGKPISADKASAGGKLLDDKASARILASRRDSAKKRRLSSGSAADEASTLIYNHTPPRSPASQPAAGDLPTTDTDAAEPAHAGQARNAERNGLP